METLGSRLTTEFQVGAMHSRAGLTKPGDSKPDIRFRVGDSVLRDSAKHCTFAGDDCWYVRTHPTIKSISEHSGYTTGGQELKITGSLIKGETFDDVEVLIDGTPCYVTENNQDEIHCTTKYSVTGVSAVKS